MRYHDSSSNKKEEQQHGETRRKKQKLFFLKIWACVKNQKTRLKHKKYEIGKKNSRREIINATNLSLNLKTEQI